MLHRSVSYLKYHSRMKLCPTSSLRIRSASMSQALHSNPSQTCEATNRIRYNRDSKLKLNSSSLCSCQICLDRQPSARCITTNQSQLWAAPRSISRALRRYSTKQDRLKAIENVPTLKDFLQGTSNIPREGVSQGNGSAQDYQAPYITKSLKFHIETYGCQMNSSDSDIVRSILLAAGHQDTASIDEAELILTNTCAVRENAETKVFNRLKYFQSLRDKYRVSLRRAMKSSRLQSNQSDIDMNTNYMVENLPLVGVLGCMAERLKEKLLDEKAVDLVCGPDAYRDLPRLLSIAVNKSLVRSQESDTNEAVTLTSSADQLAANVKLSLEETYEDITPAREMKPSVEASAFVSIMRGCNNMCSFCIVPFTRGRERSRPIDSILKEIKYLVHRPKSDAVAPVREVMLLGQNVNGYHDISPDGAERYPNTRYQAADGFSNLYNSRKRELPGPRFADLLDAVSVIHPELRVRFTSPHPKDFPDEVLDLIALRPNICKSIHLPIQSGSTSVLARMRRGYTREAYLNLVRKIRERIPGVTISTDVIAGFCGETEEEHRDTVAMMKEVKFDQAFMFAYSLRDKTHASHTMEDNVPPEIKQRRLQEIIDAYTEGLNVTNNLEIGKCHLVLVEGPSKSSLTDQPAHKRSKYFSLTGRTDGNKRVVFPLSEGHKLFPSMEAYRSAPLLDLTMNPMDATNSYKHSDIDTAVNTFQQGISRSSSPNVDGLIKVDSLNALYGSYVVVKILKGNGPTLRGVPVAISSISEYSKLCMSSL